MSQQETAGLSKEKDSNEPHYEKKTQGAVGTVIGAVYHVKLLIWYFLHFYNAGINFIMLAEWKKAENLDDIALFYGKMENKKHKNATLAQLKYRTKETAITDENFLDYEGRSKKLNDFALIQFLESYCKILKKKTFENTVIDYIAVVTNTDLSKNLKKYFTPCSLSELKGSVLEIPKPDEPKSNEPESPEQEKTWAVYKLNAQGIDKFLNEIKSNIQKSCACLSVKPERKNDLRNIKRHEIEKFLTILRVVKTFNEVDLSSQIKKELGPLKVEKYKIDIIHDKFFRKMLDWYRNPVAEYFDNITAKKWFGEVNELLDQCRFSSNSEDFDSI